jgi:pyrroline-5-carboxylate reductase
MKVGFVGCGTIAAAICTGLNSQTSDASVKITHSYVSTRSASKSTALLEKFGPDKITVMENNQDIVDSAELVFLCVLPQHYEEVLGSLTFDGAKHTLCSLVSTSTVAKLIEKSGLPADRVHKMICLPSVATHDGTCLMTPPSDSLKTILSTLGGAVQCESEKIMTAMMIPACLMGPYYRILKQNRDWLIAQGVPAADASYFTGRTYLGIAKDAEANCADPMHFDDLIAEQTPGGINEQSIQNLERLGAFDMYDKTCDAILERLEGRGDGNRG